RRRRRSAWSRLYGTAVENSTHSRVRTSRPARNALLRSPTVPHAVLLAESEHAARGFLAGRLAQDGYEVVGAAACGEALELAERARPDLVVVGTPLPDATGL